MNKNSRSPFNVGTSSVLLIFVILCLVSFAVLSLVSALSDYKLSQNVADNTTAYYDACNSIEDQLNQIDVRLKSLYDTGISRKGYFDEVGQKMSFACPISDIQSLTVDIVVLYPEISGDNFYEITSWEIVTTGSLEYDDSLPVAK